MSAEIIELTKKIKNLSDKCVVLTNENMSGHTTFKVGGPADVFVIPDSIDTLKKIVPMCHNEGINSYIIGRGSNLLVGDKGFRGIIICIYNTLDNIDITKEEDYCYVQAGAGVMLTKLAMKIADEGYEGFEFAAGIPGTLGGAITMNAGAYGGEIKDSIVKATLMDESGEIFTLSADELDLGYRKSIIQEKGYIVLSADFRLKKGDKELIHNTINELNGKRRDKQPLEFPSAGSTFKRPQGYFAGKLIQDSGLAGYRVGGACVSTKHCGFVINDKQAKAEDIVGVIKGVDKNVYEKFGIHLEPEVKMIGEF